MIKVLENVFSDYNLFRYQHAALESMTHGLYYWTPYEEFSNPAHTLHEMIGNVWKLWLEDNAVSPIDGAEFWMHHRTPQENNYLDWHIDGDEYHMQEVLIANGFSENLYQDPEERARAVKFLQDNPSLWKTPYMGCVIYLDTTDLEGGNLEIDDGNTIHSLSPKQNSVVFFKAADYNHRVTAVTKGVRTIVASNLWAQKSSEENYVKLLS